VAEQLLERLQRAAAQWWRQSWNRKSSSLAASAGFSNPVRTFRRRHTRPARGPGIDASTP